MARTINKPDYLNLPFEVYFNRMEAYGYELIHDIGKNPKHPKDYVGIIVKNIRSFGVTFRSENNGDGSLAYVLAGRLAEFPPDCFKVVDEEDQVVQYEEINQFDIDGYELRLGKEIDEDDLDGFDYGTSWEFYSCEGVTPAYLVLDADRTRVVVDSEGYCLAEDDTRIGEKPLVEFTKKDLDLVELSNSDFEHIRMEIAEYFKK